MKPNVNSSLIQKKTITSEYQGGYIALASILVIMAIVISIGVSVSLISITDAQLSLAGKKHEEAYNLAYTCVEDALLKLNENNTIPTSMNYPGGTCSITIDSQIGNNWTFTAQTAIDGYSKEIQVTASRDTTITILSWNEL